MYKFLCRDSELTLLLTALEKQGCMINRFDDRGITILEDWKENRGEIMFAAEPQTTIILNPRTGLPEKVFKIKYTKAFATAMKANRALAGDIDFQLDPKDLGRELDKVTKQ